MPEKEEAIRIAFYIDGDLARAFTEERRKTLVPKAELARAALVFFLNAQGYRVRDTTGPWGGYRERSEEDSEPGELVPSLDRVAV